MHMTTTYHWTLTMRQVLSSPFRPTFALPWLQANNASLINSLYSPLPRHHLLHL